MRRTTVNQQPQQSDARAAIAIQPYAQAALAMPFCRG
jgi:hypothetical protein